MPPRKRVAAIGAVAAGSASGSNNTGNELMTTSLLINPSNTANLVGQDGAPIDTRYIPPIEEDIEVDNSSEGSLEGDSDSDTVFSDESKELTWPNAKKESKASSDTIHARDLNFVVQKWEISYSQFHEWRRRDKATIDQINEEDTDIYFDRSNENIHCKFYLRYIHVGLRLITALLLELDGLTEDEYQWKSDSKASEYFPLLKSFRRRYDDNTTVESFEQGYKSEWTKLFDLAVASCRPDFDPNNKDDRSGFITQMRELEKQVTIQKDDLTRLVNAIESLTGPCPLKMEDWGLLGGFILPIVPTSSQLGAGANAPPFIPPGFSGLPFMGMPRVPCPEWITVLSFPEAFNMWDSLPGTAQLQFVTAYKPTQAIAMVNTGSANAALSSQKAVTVSLNTGKNRPCETDRQSKYAKVD